ncbi:MAG: ABC transporter substrate-binding protein [Rhodovibrionaceae bacterium]|nr:ABC transporter substrate-binding protein [Rhodovibrionaceae bacterium]
MSDFARIERLLRTGGISRRDFMQQATALGLTAAAASSIAGRAARAATPKKGGILRLGIGHGSTTDTLDPATYENLYMQVVGGAAHNKLTVIDNNGELAPELAESWEPTPDATQWRFKLRKGVEFHNGKTLDADDVIASFNHHRGEESKSAAKPIVDPIEDIKADGKDTVVFTMKTGNADFPFIVGDYHLAILPAKDGKIEPNSGVGAGGYTIDRFDPGVRTGVTRFPNYWKDDRAHFDAAEILSIVDGTARTNALTTGEIDAMDRVDLKTAHLLAKRPDIKIAETSGTAHYTFAMRTDTPPFNDNNVRLALKHALDRETMMQTVLLGHGVLGNDHPIGRSNRFYAEELPQREYDVDKAKFYLKQSGLSSLQVDLSASEAAFAGAVDAAVLYKEHAAKAGIEINVVREPSDGYWSNVWMKKPWCAVYWGGRPTEDWMFSTAYAAGAPWNDSFWEHERFNKLLIEARAELDTAKRREMYVEMQRIVRDEGGVVVPMFNNYVMGLSTKLAHDKMGANWSMDGFRCVERWWFA